MKPSTFSVNAVLRALFLFVLLFFLITFSFAQSSIIRKGTITTQNLVPAGDATAGSAVEISTRGATTLTIQTVGTYTGALSVQFTLDGTNWETSAGSILLNTVTMAYSATIASAAQEVYMYPVAGYVKARVTGLAAMTGSVAVTLTTSPNEAPIMALAQAVNVTLSSGTTITPVPLSTQGFTTYHTLIAAATTNATSVKTSAGTIGIMVLSNKSAAVKYVKFFNKASAPTVGTDTPIFNFEIPAGQAISINLSAMNLRFTTGIAYAITGGQALLDNTAVAAGDVVVNFAYL